MCFHEYLGQLRPYAIKLSCHEFGVLPDFVGQTSKQVNGAHKTQKIFFGDKEFNETYIILILHLEIRTASVRIKFVSLLTVWEDLFSEIGTFPRVH